MSRLAILAFVAFAGAALADDAAPPKLEPLPAPPPPQSDATGEPSVRIPVQEGDKVEEIRNGDEVIMLKVTPKEGPTYYLVQTAKGGWARRDSLDDGVRVPMWVIQTFE
jgi:hypothetical protein